MGLGSTGALNWGQVQLGAVSDELLSWGGAQLSEGRITLSHVYLLPCFTVSCTQCWVLKSTASELASWQYTLPNGHSLKCWELGVKFQALQQTYS